MVAPPRASVRSCIFPNWGIEEETTAVGGYSLSVKPRIHNISLDLTQVAGVNVRISFYDTLRCPANCYRVSCPYPSSYRTANHLGFCESQCGWRGGMTSPPCSLMARLSFSAVVPHSAKLFSDSTNLLLFLRDLLLYIAAAAVSAGQLLSTLIFKLPPSLYPPSMDLYSQRRSGTNICWG